MLVFCELNKELKENILPILFDLLYDNMQTITPFEGTYTNERVEWIACISQALERPQRKILLCLEGDQVIAFAQYYTRGAMVMIEELQLRRDYQRTMLFLRFARALAGCLLPESAVLESYADRRNHNSLRLMKQLGMSVVDEDDRFYHMRGDAVEIKKLFCK